METKIERLDIHAGESTTDFMKRINLFLRGIVERGGRIISSAPTTDNAHTVLVTYEAPPEPVLTEQAPAEN